MKKRFYQILYDKPVYLLVITIASVFASELLIMLFLYQWHGVAKQILDSSLLSLLIAPSLYVLLYVPLIKSLKISQSAEEKLKNLNKSLEEIVFERTKELARINRLMTEEYTEALRLSEERYKNVIERLGVGVSVIEADMKILSANSQMLRWHPTVDLSQNPVCFKAYVSEAASEPCSGCPVTVAFATGSITRNVLERNVGGEIRNHQIIASPIFGRDGKIIAVTEVVEDVTEQKAYNESLEEAVRQRTNELSEAESRYRSLVQNSSDGIFVFDPQTLMVQEANKQFLTMTGYSEAEIKQLKVVDFVLANRQDIRDKIEKMVNHLETVNVTRHFKIKDGSVLEVEVSGSIIRYAETKVCLVNVRDISERKRAEQARLESMEELRRTLYAGVNALVQLVEKRDPYTAGHQKRVSILAAEIATAMGLDAAKVEYIRLAGALHDIGKIYIPIDILNKPGRLTEMEMALIKTHSQVSFEVLEQIPFKMNVAQVVLQHHERINGSGYPHGLKGEDILVEAKILSVADVVEAMSYHRPYRPAIGLKKAVQELSQNKGILYEATVVDAFLKLIEQDANLLQRIDTEVA